MGEFAIGQSVRRREDPRLLRGNGRYFDDLKLADQVFAAIVRSPDAHADIRGIDAAEALKMPGAHAVLTGEDYRADGLGSIPSLAPYKKRDGSPMYLPPRPAIAIGRAMHVGYPVAVVVADTLDIARDAAERVAVDYAPRPAVVSARHAFEKDAPQLYDDCPGNETYFYQAGDKAGVDAAFMSATHVVEQRLVINRVTANPIEPRGVTGVYDTGTGRYTLHCGFQRPWLFRNGIAETTLKIPENLEPPTVVGDLRIDRAAQAVRAADVAGDEAKLRCRPGSTPSSTRSRCSASSTSTRLARRSRCGRLQPRGQRQRFLDPSARCEVKIKGPPSGGLLFSRASRSCWYQPYVASTAP